MLPQLDKMQLWFITGSQHLYGPKVLEQVASDARAVVKTLNDGKRIVSEVVCKGVVTTPEEIRAVCLDASHDCRCAGVILWMHTFSPSKMWIGGLKALTKPMLHLHTQFHRDLPWDSIDMDYMNLHQSAHGDREAGYIHSRLRLSRKVVVGHYSEADVQDRIGAWGRAAAAWHDLQGARFCRIGDNMRFVAVTEGDKTAAEARFGFSVNTHGVGDLVEVIKGVSDKEIDQLMATYASAYEMAAKDRTDSIREAARIEAGLRAFLSAGNYKGFTTTFEDLHGLRQLPGLAPQRLMADGYGFAAEGDWKTAALLRAMKVMGSGLVGGTSFMEDYTYHLDPKNPLVLGSHMLEICPSIAAGKPSLQVHPLGIGGKEDPARLVFDAPAGAALNCSLIDMGNRFRLVMNEVEVVAPPKPLPKLPVARAVWKCKPDFKTACAAWIYAGGAHHSGFSYAVTAEHLADFAEIANVELVKIDARTELESFRRELKFNEVYYHLANGFGGL